MTTLTLSEAAAKYGIEQKKLIGHALRNDFADPLVVDRDESGVYAFADDWRLERLANPQRSDKANERVQSDG